MSTEIVKVEAPKELAAEQVSTVKEAFKPHIEAMGELEPRYQALTAEKLAEPSKQQCKEARAVRLALVKTRTGTAKTHKELKADALVYSRYLDGMKKAQELACTQRECDLLEIEKHFENAEKERVASLQAKRADLLSKLGVQHQPANLGEMDEDVWEVYYDNTYQDCQRRKEAERKEAEERAAREKAEAEEQERIRLENEKLKAEAAERDRVEKERQAREQADRDAREEEARKERERLENIQRQQEAKAKAEREEAERKLQAERQERERLEREKAEAEAKAKADREAEESRLADQNHRDNIDNEALTELVDLTGLHEDVAAEVLGFIKSGKIPHVTINY